MNIASEAESPSVSAGRERAADAAIAVTSICLVIALGQGIMFFAPGYLVLAPLAGVMAALACRRPIDAAVAAFVAVPLGTFAATALSQATTVPITAWLADSLLTAGIAAFVAAATCWGLAAQPRLRAAAAALAVALIVFALAYTAVTMATAKDAQGSSIVSAMSYAAPLASDSADHSLFLRAVSRVRSGESYHRAMAETLLESNDAGRPFNEAASVFSYRLPTLYVYFALLPMAGTPIMLSLALVGSLATVASYLLARTVVREPLALVGCTAVAAYYGFVAGSFGALGTEPYAGAFGLAAVALLAASYRSPRRTAYLWAAAFAALLAALVRELAVPFALLGLIATVVDPKSRARRDWIPWTVALACIALAYVGHVVATRAVISSLQILPKPSDNAFPWFSVDGLGLRAAVNRLAAVSGTRLAVAWVLVIAGCVGAIAGPRDLGTRVMAGAATLGGAIVYLFVHPNGAWVEGLPPAYWGDVIVPTILGCAALCFALVPYMRRAGRSDETPCPESIAVDA